MSEYLDTLVARRRRIMSSVRATVRIARNAVRMSLSRADYERWNSPGGLEEWWDERTRLLASLVPPASRIIEFGAGRRQLERYLPADCVYIPSDLSDRGPGTFVCDLNRRPLPDLRSMGPTVAVFGGVLEYLRDVESLVSWLVESGIATCVVSFDAVPLNLSLEDRLKEFQRRLNSGYMNNLTKPDIEAIFQRAGMVCVEQRRWTHQDVYRFVRRPTTA